MAWHTNSVQVQFLSGETDPPVMQKEKTFGCSYPMENAFETSRINALFKGCSQNGEITSRIEEIP